MSHSWKKQFRKLEKYIKNLESENKYYKELVSKRDIENSIKMDFITDAIEEARNSSYWFECRDDIHYFSNPTDSRIEVSLTGIEASIMLFCQLWDDRRAMGKNTEVSIATYQKMRQAMFALNPMAFMKILN